MVTSLKLIEDVLVAVDGLNTADFLPFDGSSENAKSILLKVFKAFVRLEIERIRLLGVDAITRNLDHVADELARVKRMFE